MKLTSLITGALAVCVLASVSEPAFAIDKERKLLRKYDCNKCHSISREKDGPSYQKIAKDYRDDPEAMEKLYEHVTTEVTVEVEGEEEIHEPIETDNRKQIEAIIRWILSN